MAVDLPNLELIISLIREFQPKRILSFGHPDILVDDADIHNRFGIVGDNGGAHALFRQLGAELTAVDLRGTRGVDNLDDLNFPLSDCQNFSYDMIIDSGTAEHIFNVAQVFASVVMSLKNGGIVYHCNPLAMFNHGYWNVSPVAYKDFYEQNGFEIIRLDMQRKNEFISLERDRRFRLENDGKVMMVCVARKTRHPDRIIFPMQAKYQ